MSQRPKTMLERKKTVFTIVSFFLLTLSQTSPGFYVSAVQVFLKTLQEKEKLLVTSNFSFLPLCFLPCWRSFCHIHQIWNCRLQFLSVWKSVKNENILGKKENVVYHSFVFPFKSVFFGAIQTRDCVSDNRFDTWTNDRYLDTFFF